MTTVQVELTDQELLVETLKAMGYSPEVHEEAQSITGYGGRAYKKANVIVKKNQMSGAYADVGFEKTKTGFNVHIDNSDTTKFGLNKLKRNYGESKVMKVINGTNKYTVKSRKVDAKNQIRIRATVNY